MEVRKPAAPPKLQAGAPGRRTTVKSVRGDGRGRGTGKRQERGWRKREEGRGSAPMELRRHAARPKTAGRGSGLTNDGEKSSEVVMSGDSGTG